MFVLQIRPVWIFTFILFLPLSLQAAITTKVDRSSLYQGEKLTLTIKIDSKVDQRPELIDLEKDFHLLGTKKTTLSSHSTGEVKTSTQWQLKLRAVTKGTIEIPVITLGEEYSSTISINVLPSELNPAPEETGLKQFFIDIEVDKDELYVNSQAILRVKIHHLNPLPLDSQLSRPNIRNAIVKELEQRKEYKTQVNNQEYFVTEYSYTLYPRVEGAVEVEPFFFNSTLGNGEILDLSSSLLLLKVLPKAFTNTREIWIPAESVYIEDNLSEINQIENETALLRIITLEAEGVPASNLPLLSDMSINNAEVKLTNVVLEEQMTESGIISRRMEELEITPLSNAKVILPAIDLPWWDTGLERAQNATISQRIIQKIIPTTVPVNPLESTSDTSVSKPNTGYFLIWLLTAITIVTTLGCIYAFYFLRKSKTAVPETKEETPAHEKALQQLATDVAERNAFKSLVLACEQSNPQLAKIKLIEWGQLFFRNMDLSSTEQICELAANGTLKFLVVDMENYLISNPHLWHGDLLIEEVEKVRNRRKRLEAESYKGDETLNFQN
ncbi:MAG: BatD family protein [Neptuniibacter sp.]